MKISWPTAVVLVTFIVAWVALLALHVAVPTWMAAAGTSVGAIILAALEAVVKGATDGSGTTATSAAQATKATSTNGPVPPAAARTWTAPRVFALPVAAALSLAGCTNGVPNPQTVTDVTVGLNGAICVLTTYSTDVAAGKGEAEAVADAAVKCGLSIAQATGLLDAHRKAETLEASKQAAAK